MLKFGLLGEKLGHSFSPAIHKALGDYEYGLYEVPPASLKSFLEFTELEGMNVTIPYKRDVMACCASLSERAEAIGSVNTLVRTPYGWHGDNTDYVGFVYMCRSIELDPKGKKVLVFGSGGASRTVIKVMEDMLAGEIVVISRRGENNYENLDLHADAKIIVNATPLGMYPNNGQAPACIELFPECEAVLDLVYNPARTALLMDAEARGIKCCNGLGMLVAQAHAAAELFLNKRINGDIIGDIRRKLEKDTRNIVLIGMPGSGKTEKGKLLAKRLGREFVDADEYFTVVNGISPAEVIKSRGEGEMRAMETEVLEELGRKSGAVISTGGGCVTRMENYPLLHQNSLIVWVKRPLSELSTRGRPLSQSCGVQELYARRRAMYERFADVSAESCASIEKAVDAIMEAIG